MKRTRSQPVIAIGIDSAEPTLIRDLIERGELPSLGALLDGGAFARVDSRGDIGSGAVWPTFFTGMDPTEHGMYSGWVWQPDKMTCTGPGDDFFPDPFWTSSVKAGAEVGIFDVPWAPFGSVRRGFEVSEWGPHDISYGEVRSRPAGAASAAAALGPHPFYEVPHGPGYSVDREGKERLSSACVLGASLRGELAVRLLSQARPQLSVVVFTEVHHATHQLWHTVQPDHYLYAGREFPSQIVRPDLVDVYREVDRQVGRMVEAAGPDAAAMAFSLHGMMPGPGIPTVLEPLLEATGLAAPATWKGLSWPDRGAVILGAAKRHAPHSIKRIYHRRASFRSRFRVAQPTIVAPHDWSRTRAFSLPTDQRGYLRVNLRDRESRGIVPPRDYDPLCEHITELLNEARSVDGDPLVRGVLRTAPGGAAPPRHLPDLIVDWDDAAFADPVHGRIGSSEFEAEPIRKEMSGQHAPHGFCILGERLADGSSDGLVAGTELHRILLSGLGSEAVATAG